MRYEKKSVREEPRYVEVAHFEDSETVERFLELHGQDQDSAVSFLFQWDYGEHDGEPGTVSQMTEGLLFTNRAKHGGYLALWQSGVAGITLYRKITG